MGSGEGRIGGVAMGVAVGVAGVSWGADLVWMSATGSFWGLDRTEVLCFRRWEEVWVGTGDRMKDFRCDA